MKTIISVMEAMKVILKNSRISVKMKGTLRKKANGIKRKVMKISMIKCKSKMRTLTCLETSRTTNPWKKKTLLKRKVSIKCSKISTRTRTTTEPERNLTLKPEEPKTKMIIEADQIITEIVTIKNKLSPTMPPEPRR